MELSTSSPSLTLPPPSFISTSKSSDIYPVVHPVPDPSAQAGFSSVPLYTAGHTDKASKDSSSSSHTDSEKTDQSSSLHVDSFIYSNKPSSAVSLAVYDESKEISSHLSGANCENESSSSSCHPVPLKPEKTCKKLHESEEEKVHKTAQEKLDEIDDIKVKVYSCVSIVCLKTAW